MKINKLLWFPLCIIVLSLVSMQNVLGQTLPLKLDVDCADFKYDNEVNYLEVYYTVNKTGVSYEKTGKGDFMSSLHMILTIHDSDSLIRMQQWKMQSTEKDTANIDPSQSAIDCIKLTIPPGEYTLKLVAKDLLATENCDSVAKKISINPISKKLFSASDFELAGSVRRIEKDLENPFFKNSLEVMPNPSGVFGFNNKYAYFYTELYNIHQNFKDTGYSIKYYVLNSDGDIEKEVDPEIKKRSGKFNSAVLYGALKVGELQSGSYSFKLDILNSDNTIVLSRSKKILVYNATRIPETKTINTFNTAKLFASSEFAGLTESQVKEEYLKILYISSHQDQNFYKTLSSLEEKRKWLFQFWNASDSNPETKVNEFRMEYVRRIEYANKFFKEMGVKGWKTDRGRIYCIYGEANYVERFPSEPGQMPYELWHYYDLQGGGEFVFGDTQGNDEYQLLHASVRGEVKNTNWKSLLRK